jgi:predicted transport protein
MYSFFEKKLKALREYIDKNLIKGYIRFSKLFIKYTVLFVSKKNEKLRIYVNYRKFNNIIIKNRYTLSLIYEI